MNTTNCRTLGRLGLFILLTCFFGSSKGGVLLDEDASSYDTYQVTSGTLYMGGEKFVAPFKIVSDGYNVSVSGMMFSRFIDFRKFSEEKNQRLQNGKFSARDLLLAVCDSISLSESKGKNSKEVEAYWQNWVNSKMASVGGNPVTIKYNDIAGEIFVERGTKGRPMVYQILPKEECLARLTPREIPQHRETLKIIVDSLEENWVVAWGRGYTEFFNLENNPGIVQILEDISSGVYPGIIPVDRNEFGLEEILGKSLTKQLIFDLANPENEKGKEK